MQAPDLGDDGVVFRRVYDLDRPHVLVDDRHELRRRDADGRREEFGRLRLIAPPGLQVVAHRVQARQPLAYVVRRLGLGRERGDLVFDDCSMGIYADGIGWN